MGLRDRKGRRQASGPGPDGLAMVIKEVFWVGAPPDAKLGPAQRRLAAQAPGTVLVGVLDGTGSLRAGDLVVHPSGRFSVQTIEAFQKLLDTAQPPQSVGLRLGTAVDRALFSPGDQVGFERPT